MQKAVRHHQTVPAPRADPPAAVEATIRQAASSRQIVTQYIKADGQMLVGPFLSGAEKLIQFADAKFK